MGILSPDNFKKGYSITYAKGILIVQTFSNGRKVIFMIKTIKDLAEAAHVSTATVSRALHNSGYVNEETKKLILKLANESNFRPKHYHHKTDSGNELVGIIVADLHNIFFQEIIAAINDKLYRHHVDTIICNSDESPQKEIRSISMLHQRNVNGIIISPISETVKYNANYLKELNESGTSVVLVDRDLKGYGIDGVFQDNYDASTEAVETLIKAGHKDIAIIAGPISSKPGLDRLNAYIDTLSQHQIEIHRNYIFYGDFKTESSYQLTKEILKLPVTAIFCTNNLMALGAIRAIYDAGLSIPNDISVVSFGSMDSFDLFHDPFITEIQQPTFAMGNESACIMLDKLHRGKKNRPSNAKRIVFDSELVLRGSEIYPSQTRTIE